MEVPRGVLGTVDLGVVWRDSGVLFDLGVTRELRWVAFGLRGVFEVVVKVPEVRERSLSLNAASLEAVAGFGLL